MELEIYRVPLASWWGAFFEPQHDDSLVPTKSPSPLVTHPQGTILSSYKSDPALVIGDQDKGPYIELVQKFVQVFHYILWKKIKRTYGPT